MKTACPRNRTGISRGPQRPAGRRKGYTGIPKDACKEVWVCGSLPGGIAESGDLSPHGPHELPGDSDPYTVSTENNAYTWKWTAKVARLCRGEKHPTDVYYLFGFLMESIGLHM